MAKWICPTCGGTHFKHHCPWEKHGKHPLVEALKREYPPIQQLPIQQQYVPQQSETYSSETKKCPYCAEMIKTEAIKCRFCWSDLNETPVKSNEGLPERHKSPQALEDNFSRANEAYVDDASYKRDRALEAAEANLERAAEANFVAAYGGVKLYEDRVETSQGILLFSNGPVSASVECEGEENIVLTVTASGLLSRTLCPKEHSAQANAVAQAVNSSCSGYDGFEAEKAARIARAKAALEDVSMNAKQSPQSNEAGLLGADKDEQQQESGTKFGDA